jgi:hypothetical protein
VERPSISTNHIARNQEFSLSTFHTKVKVQRLLQFKMLIFLRRRRTLEGSLSRMGMETQIVVERPSVFFAIQIGKISALRLEGSFWARNEVGCSFGWVWTLGLVFGGFTICPAKGSTNYILLVDFNPFLFGLSTKFPHSISRPLDLDDHSVKRPLTWVQDPRSSPKSS